MTPSPTPRRLLRALALAAALLPALAARPRAQTVTAPVVQGLPVGVSSVTWTWNFQAAATGYNVFVPPGTLIQSLPASTTYFFLTGLSTNTASTAVIEATGPGGPADSAQTTVYTLAAAPSDTFLIEQDLPSSEQIGWQPNGNPSGTLYNVDWWISGSTAIVFSTFSVTSVPGSTVTATISDLPGGQTVNFQVFAFNGAGLQTQGDVVVSTGLPALPNQPVISSASFALGFSSITWYWAASTGALAYQVFEASSGVVSPVSGLLPASQTSFTETGLSANTPYTNFVTAYGTTASTNSAGFALYTLAAPTTFVTLLNVSSTAATALLYWGANGNPADTQYDVLWWSAVSSTMEVAVSTGVDPTLVTGLFGGNTLYFTVNAVNGDGIVSSSTYVEFESVQSTYFPVSQQTLGPGESSTLTFLLQNAEVQVQIATGTFLSTVTISAQNAADPTSSFCPSLSTLGTPPRLSQIMPTPMPICFDVSPPVTPVIPIPMLVTYVPGTIQNVSEQSLTLAFYDPNHDAWVTLATGKSGATLSTTVDPLPVPTALFQVFSTAAPETLSDITVGPNPLRPVVNPGEVMTFRNLPAGARVRIFTYVGEKIFDSSADASGTVAWDGRNKQGSMVASGVYIVLIQGAGTKKLMRVAVER